MKKKMTYGQALNDALHYEMERDERVFVYGIDVQDHKSIFGTTEGLPERFGEERCFSTPLSEDAMTGFGAGAASQGLRPVQVHIRADFLLLASNQIANMLAPLRYGSCGQLSAPMVIRVIIGRGWGQAWQHSKSMYSWFAHIPGLKVYLPTSPNDARQMLISAIRDDNPVLFFEHRWLYFCEDEVEQGDPVSGDAECCKVLLEGDDVTIVSLSWMTVEALQAAQVLAKHGVKAEVVDVRSISPLDMDTIEASARKTKRVIIADYDWLPCGISGEISTQLYDRCYRELKAPIERLGFAFTQCPCTRPLENRFYTRTPDIIHAVEKLLGIAPVDIGGENFYSHENKFKGPF